MGCKIKKVSFIRILCVFVLVFTCPAVYSDDSEIYRKFERATSMEELIQIRYQFFGINYHTALELFLLRTGWEKLSRLPHPVLETLCAWAPDHFFAFKGSQGFAFDRDPKLTIMSKIRLRAAIWDAELSHSLSRLTYSYFLLTRPGNTLFSFMKQWSLPWVALGNLAAIGSAYWLDSFAVFAAVQPTLILPYVALFSSYLDSRDLNQHLREIRNIYELDKYATEYQIPIDAEKRRFIDAAQGGKIPLMVMGEDFAKGNSDSQMKSLEQLDRLLNLDGELPKSVVSEKDQVDTAVALKIIPEGNKGRAPYYYRNPDRMEMDTLWLPAEHPFFSKGRKVNYIGLSNIDSIVGKGVWAQYPNIDGEKYFFYSEQGKSEIPLSGETLQVWRSVLTFSQPPAKVIMGQNAASISELINLNRGCRDITEQFE